MYILFRAQGQELKRIDSEKVAADSKGFLAAKFEVDDEWNDLALEAVFEQNGKKFVKVLSDGACDVPAEVLNTGRFKVWLVGVNSESVIRATTEGVNVDILRGPGYDAENSAEPTPSEVEQILTIAQSVRDDADNGAFDGAPGKDGISFEVFKTKDELVNYANTTTAYKVRFIWGGEKLVYNMAWTLNKYGVYDAVLKDTAGGNMYDSITELIILSGGGTGEIDPEKIKQFIKEYLQLNPPAIEEKDPTVPAWAKAETPPKYTAADVGALPKDTKIPGKTSDLFNDSGYITDSELQSKGYAKKTEIPTTLPASDVYSWAKQPNKPAYSAIEVGADPKGTVTAHNTNESAHGDIRILIAELTTRLNTVANSDDVNLDQLGEIVAYIKSNKTLIEEITTNKVNVADIIDNLTTNVSNKPLSAAQGVALKALIDNLSAGKLDASKLIDAINTALEQAKASGEFDGKDGDDYVLTDSDMDEIAVIAMQNEKGNIVQQILAELQGLPVFGVVDEDKIITVTSQLTDGTYTIKYEYADGTVGDIGTIVIGTGGGSGSDPVITGITAKYTGGNVTEGTSVNALTGITVTATYSDGSTETVTGYTLSGTIGVGNNTITVSYNGFTTTFTVTGNSAAPTYVNLIPTATTPTNASEVFNGKGYMDGKYASSSSPYYGDDSATFVTGLIPATFTSVFYIKGVTINTSNSHNRLAIFNHSRATYSVKQFSQLGDVATLETLGTQYYKLTLNTSTLQSALPNGMTGITFSAMGSGASLIVSATPIE